MPQIEFDDLSEDVKVAIFQLQNDVDDLKFESHFYRGAAIVVLGILIERLWERFF